jgi:polyisoprenoid-binding protein YceI
MKWLENLTINGITKPVTLDVDFGGINVDPWGNTKAGFSFEGKSAEKILDLTGMQLLKQEV